MAHIQNYLDPVERIQGENICIEDIPRQSDPDDSCEDEDSIVD